MPYRNINPQIRGAGAYRGTIGSSAPLAAPPAQKGILDALGQTVSDFAGAAAARSQYDPDSDPRALLAKQRKQEIEQAARQDDARRDIRSIAAALDDTGSNMAQVRRAATVRGADVGLDMKEVEDILASMVATMGDENTVARSRTLNAGATASSQAFTPQGRTAIRDEAATNSMKELKEREAGLSARNKDDIAGQMAREIVGQAGQDRRNTADNVYSNIRNRADNFRAVETNNADNAAAAARAKEKPKEPRRSAITPMNVDDLEKEMNKQMGVTFDDNGKQTAGPEMSPDAYVAVAKAAAEKIDAGMDTVSAVAEARAEAIEIEKDVILEEGFFSDKRGDRVKVKAPPVAPPVTGAPAAAGAPSASGGEPAPTDPAERVANTVYATPKGPMKWTGTGWVTP